MSPRLPISLLIAATARLYSATPDENLLSNPGFEEGGAGSWQWHVANSANAVGNIDNTSAHGGGWSYKISKTGEHVPDVYGALRQIISVEPDTKYTISAWGKGTNVDRAMVITGEDWDTRVGFRNGTYDWSEISRDFTTKPHETQIPVVIVAEGPTESFWVDDVRVVKAGGEQTSVRVFEPTVASGVPAAAKFYPLFSKSASASRPSVRLVSKTNPLFAAEFSMWADKDTLFIECDVTPAVSGVAISGDQMWRGDSIQIGIESEVEKSGDNSGRVPLEIGLSVPSAQKVATYAWSGNIDFSTMKLTGNRTGSNWKVSAEIPWKTIHFDPEKLPESFGLNLVVNSGDGHKVRDFIEWTPGLADHKDSSEFARVHIAPQGVDKISFIQLAKNTFDRKEKIRGKFIEYTQEKAAERSLSLGVSDESGTAVLAPDSVTLPATRGNETRCVDFDLPASLLPRDGKYAASAAPDKKSPITGVFEVEDSAAKIASLKDALMKSVERLREIAVAKGFENDTYVKLALTVLDRFQNRLTSSVPTPDEWALLQIAECRKVIADANEYIEKGNLRVAKPDDVPTRPVVRNGLLFNSASDGGNPPAGSQPVFRYGFVGWAPMIKDLDVIRNLGGTLIQTERGPHHMSENVQDTNNAGNIRDTLSAAQSSAVMLDLLLSPHNFPDWAVRQDPELFNKTDAVGWLRYRLTNPTALKVIERWLRTVVPIVKDEPALFSFCLSNEPTSIGSGRDPYSRPEWIKYLRQKHGTIQVLNKLYDTRYASFEEVDVPPLGMPGDLPGKRKYYDWVRFNQAFFAGWHRWMNDIIKSLAPNIPTHAKIMCTIFDPTTLANGVDPELFCDITDLAGNDCCAFPGAYQEYGYNWRHEEMWYDLLHSFRNQPVYNSENHLIADGTPAVHVSSAHVRSVLWQGALHHQAATAIWVWAEPDNRDLAGSIYLRPASLHAAGKAFLDLERLAPEVAAVSSCEEKVALLYSMTSIFWQPDYLRHLASAYTALTFSGHPVTFVSEKQILEGRLAKPLNKIQYVILPSATNVADATCAGLAEFVKSGGKVLTVGEGNLKFDEYNRPRQLDAQNPTVIPVAWDFVSDRSLKQGFAEAMKERDAETVGVNDAATGLSPWGVQYRVVPFEGDLLVSLNNLLAQPVAVRVSTKGDAVDLFDSTKVDLNYIPLAPMKPMLVRISAKRAGTEK